MAISVVAREVPGLGIDHPVADVERFRADAGDRALDPDEAPRRLLLDEPYGVLGVDEGRAPLVHVVRSEPEHRQEVERADVGHADVVLDVHVPEVVAVPGEHHRAPRLRPSAHRFQLRAGSRPAHTIPSGARFWSSRAGSEVSGHRLDDSG